MPLEMRLSVGITQARWRRRQEAVVFFTELAFLPQRLFPTLFQCSRHQAVLWFDALILTFGALRLVSAHAPDAAANAGEDVRVPV